jgi:hypothetical protein
MKRYVADLSVLTVVILWANVPVGAVSIAIENASFESPPVDPNGFGAVPLVDGWTEVDLDTEGGSNTGVFVNTPPDGPDHIANADGSQLAFLGSERGNALEQELLARFEPGREYQLTAAVGVSARFPPSMAEPVDTLELVLYYRDANEPVDIANRTIAATGLSSTLLEDFTLHVEAVRANDPWAGKPIGVAIRAAGLPGGFWDLDDVRLEESLPVSIPVENASFESPAVDPNGFGAVPFVDGWIELDLDAEAGSNTGVFLNTDANMPDHIVNADGAQLAFLGSQEGNALEQDLTAVFRVGCDYRLTVDVGVSNQFPPSPEDTIELAFYYHDANEPVDIARRAVEAAGLSSTLLEGFSVNLVTVRPDVPWANEPIGVAIRAGGSAGGFWDLDNVRLTESLPESVPIENPSFESPVVDPNDFPVLPYVDAWTELDVDLLGSTNTGVFANMPEGAWDRMLNADGGQLAFLGSEQGNGYEQELAAHFEVGRAYRLTVAVGVSGRFPPSAEPPVDTVELAFFYVDGDQTVDVACEVVEAPGLPLRRLDDFSAYLPPVKAGDEWADKPIGVAIRSAGLPGGFWDLDNVRLAASLPVDEVAATTEE